MIFLISFRKDYSEGKHLRPTFYEQTPSCLTFQIKRDRSSFGLIVVSSKRFDLFLCSSLFSMTTHGSSYESVLEAAPFLAGPLKQRHF